MAALETMHVAYIKPGMLLRSTIKTISLSFLRRCEQQFFLSFDITVAVTNHHK